jgi:hypothetical protein
MLGVYKAGSLRTVATELVRYNSELVAVQEVRWDNGGSEPAEDNTFFMEIGMLIIT